MSKTLQRRKEKELSIDLLDALDREIQLLRGVFQESITRLDQANILQSEAANQRFGAAEKAVNLVSDKMDAKFIAVAESARLVANTTDVRFQSLDDTVRLINDSYARLQLVEKAAALVSQSVDHRFNAIEKAVAYVESTYARAELVDKSTKLVSEHTASQFQATDRATQLTIDTINLRFIEIEKATSLAREALSVRLEGMNEIRSQLDRQAAAFPIRAELEALRGELMSRLATVDVARSALLDRLTTLEKNAVTHVENDALIASYRPERETYNKRVSELEAYKNTQEGKTVAQSAVIGVAVTVINIAIAIALHYLH